MSWKQIILTPVNLIEKLPNWLIIFFLSSINFLTNHPGPNEQNNFTMALHFLDPSWMESSFSLNQWSGTNAIYWSIAGFFLQFLSFSQLTFFARIFTYLMYAIPLGKLFNKLKFNKINIVLFLQLFFSYQSFMAGEWIWGGFEGKTLAYLFIFWSIYFFLNEKQHLTIIFISFSTYCHVLVGGWFFIGVCLYLLVAKIPFQRIVTICGSYFIIVSPFILYLLSHLIESQAISNSPSADWIYVFYRNRHHLAPTMKPNFWRHNWIAIALMVFSLVFLFNTRLQNKIRLTTKLAGIYNAIILIAIVISLIDKEGVILKFYLFRMTSISLFFSLLSIFILLNQSFRFGETKIGQGLTVLGFAIGVFLVTTGMLKNINSFPSQEKITAYQEFVKFIKENTENDDKFVFVGYDDKNENIQFIADTERDRFVSYKMVPEGDKSIVEWYNRLKERNRLEKSPNLNDSIFRNYSINFLVSKGKIHHLGSPLWSNSDYHIYQSKKPLPN